MAHINPGDAVRLATEFTDAAGTAADPTTVTLRIRPDGGSETVYVYGTDAEVVKDSVGNYHVDYVVPATTKAEATFSYQWEGTGAVQATEPGTFLVENDYLIPTSSSLVSLADAQSRAGDGITQDMIDEVEEDWTAVLGPLTGERTETFFLYQRRYRWLAVDGVYLTRYTDSVSVTTSTVTGSPVSLTAGTDYRLLNHHIIELVDTGGVWYDELEATYTPNDEERIRSVIFDTLSYRQTPAGLQSIRIGAYSETFFPGGSGDSDPVIGSLIKRVLPAAGLGMTSPIRYAAHSRDRTLITSTGS